MLLEFSVSNFRSIKQKQTLSLLKSKLKSDALEGNYSTITLSTGKTLEVLNSAVIYGANASGKSNLLSALATMMNTIINSFNYKKNEAIPRMELFAFGQDSDVAEFEIDFVNNQGVRFVYGFSATSEKIVDEWLYQYPKGSPQNLIDRQNTNEWGAMNALKGSKKLLKDSTKEVSLFSSTSFQFNHKLLSSVFLDILINISGVRENPDMRFTIDKIENNKKQMVLDFLQNADIGIKDIIIEKIEVNNNESEIEGMSQKTRHARMAVFMIHDDGVQFKLDQESSGTRKLFKLIGVWLEILEKGYTLVVDELQNSLHPKLVEYLVKMFHNPAINTNGAQLIFVTHETSLLDQETFRRDQIWFCEKQNNATELFSLADFKVRKGVDNLEKSYLSGRYGAVPYLK